MTRSVTFNGITRFKPGGITRITNNRRVTVLGSDNGVIGIIGEAEGGAPGSVATYTLSDNSRAVDIFRSGPVADAIGLAFSASNDPDIPGGASSVIIYKTNQSTQASETFPSEASAAVESGTSDSGTTTTLVDAALSMTTGEHIGKRLVVRPFSANTEVAVVTANDATSFTFATLSTTVGTDEYVLLNPTDFAVYPVNVGTSAGTSLVVTATPALTNDALAGRWVKLSTSASVSYIRKIVSNVGNTLTLSSSVPTMTGGAYVQVLANAFTVTSTDYGLHTNSIKVDIADGVSAGSKNLTVSFEGDSEIGTSIGGTPTMYVLYKAPVTSTDTVTGSASTATVIDLTTGGLTVGAKVGTQVEIGGEYTVVTANTANQLTVSPALSAAPAAGTVVRLTSTSGSTGSVAGSLGVASTFATATGISGDDVSVTLTSTMTLRGLANAIEANSNYTVTFAPSINPDTLLANTLDFGSNSFPILVSNHLATEGPTRTVADMVDYINSFSSYLTAVRSTAAAVDGGIGAQDIVDPAPLSGGSRGISTNSDFQLGFDELLRVRANSVVPLIDEDLINEGNGSTATVASVAAQLAAHVAAARSSAQSVAGERGGFFGFKGTKAAIINQASVINDYDVQMTCQDVSVLNATGTLTRMGPRMMAVMAASMRAGGQEIATPLTNKLIRASALYNHSSWSPTDTTDTADLIKAGVLFAEFVPGTGFKWVRDLTTYIKSDDATLTEGSIRDAVRYTAYILRSTLVRAYTGKKAKPATISSIKDSANTILSTLRSEGVIVDSRDESGGVVNAFHSLRVTSDGDVVRLSVAFFPVPGINFQLQDLTVSIPVQSA